MSEVVDHGDDLHAVAVRQTDKGLCIRARPTSAVPVQGSVRVVGIGAPEFQHHVGQVEKSREMDRLFQCVPLAFRKHTQMDRTEADLCAVTADEAIAREGLRTIPHQA